LLGVQDNILGSETPDIISDSDIIEQIYSVCSGFQTRQHSTAKLARA